MEQESPCKLRRMALAVGRETWLKPDHLLNGSLGKNGIGIQAGIPQRQVYP